MANLMYQCPECTCSYTGADDAIWCCAPKLKQVWECEGCEAEFDEEKLAIECETKHESEEK